MRTIIAPRPFLEGLGNTLNGWNDAISSAHTVATGYALGAQHRRDVGSTLASRYGSEFMAFNDAWTARDIEACKVIAARVEKAAYKGDPDLFMPPPSPADLVELQIAEFKSRGLKPDRASLTGSANFITNDDRRRLAYACLKALSARAASNSEAA